MSLWLVFYHLQYSDGVGWTLEMETVRYKTLWESPGISFVNGVHSIKVCYCKTRIVRVPFILQILRPW